MPARRGEPQADTGTYRRRRKPPGSIWWRSRPPDTIREALDGTIDVDSWGEMTGYSTSRSLRQATWERWLALVREPPDWDGLAARRAAALESDPTGPAILPPERDSDRAWPPKAARHDGIVGKVLSSRWNPPEGYVGGFDARPKIVALAEQGLAEVECFCSEKPQAAEAIVDPLVFYEELLREVRDRPEGRLGGVGPTVP
jgi:hypothetical protein